MHTMKMNSKQNMFNADENIIRYAKTRVNTKMYINQSNIVGEISQKTSKQKQNSTSLDLLM